VELHNKNETTLWWRRYVGFRVQGHFSLHSKNLRVISSKMKNFGVHQKVLGGAGRSSQENGMGFNPCAR